MEGRKIFFAVTAEKFYVAKGLRTAFFNGETPIGVLNIMGCGNHIVCDFKEILFIAAVRTFEKVRNFWGSKNHAYAVAKTCT